MLKKEEIMQLHREGVVFREGKLAGKVPFVVRTFRVSDNMRFAENMDALEITDSDAHINNIVAQSMLEGCLVSVNGIRTTPDIFKNYNAEKCNYIINFAKALFGDVIEYLEGFPEQKLTDMELEEFILTDKIERVETLSYSDDVDPLFFKYQVLPVGKVTEITESLREPLKNRKLSKMHASVLMDNAFAAATIDSINGIEITEETLNDFNVELVTFIMRRAASIENQLRDYLKNPSKIGTTLKN